MTEAAKAFKSTLDLALVGNCCISALVDGRGRIVWSCFPRFDGDPVFHALLGGPTGAPGEGCFEIELLDAASFSQSYVGNTALVRTVVEGPSGATLHLDATALPTANACPARAPAAGEPAHQDQGQAAL